MGVPFLWLKVLEVAQAFQDEVDKLLEKVTSEIICDMEPAFYSRLAPVKKASSGCKSVIYLSHTNA